MKSIEEGKTYNRLTVMRLLPTDSPRYRYAFCLCICGNVCVKRLNNLKSGHTKTCGCFRGKNNFKKPEYRIWSGIKQRCYNKNIRGYKFYGSRGITVCDRWKNSFDNFFLDMGERKDPKLTIERIDNDGNYEPSNCKWATWSEQQSNKRRLK